MYFTEEQMFQKTLEQVTSMIWTRSTYILIGRILPSLSSWQVPVSIKTITKVYFYKDIGFSEL